MNAVKGTSATSALDTQVPVASSKIAFGYLIVVHASSSMEAIAVLTAGSRRTVTDTCGAAGDRGVDGVAAVVGRVHPHQHRLAIAQEAAGLFHGVADQASRAAR